MRILHSHPRVGSFSYPHLAVLVTESLLRDCTRTPAFTKYEVASSSPYDHQLVIYHPPRPRVGCQRGANTHHDGMSVKALSSHLLATCILYLHNHFPLLVLRISSTNTYSPSTVLFSPREAWRDPDLHRPSANRSRCRHSRCLPILRLDHIPAGIMTGPVVKNRGGATPLWAPRRRRNIIS